MSKTPKSIPEFSSEAEERRFWEAQDSSDRVDWSNAEHVRLPNLKPSMASIAPAGETAESDQDNGRQRK